VRAVVNAPLTTLPQWTFYGCTSLSDVSLATATTSTGEYAFQGCSSLSTVYTQTNDIDTAYQIQQSMAQNHDDLTTDGLVASYDQPDSSTTVQDDGKKQTETEVRQTDNAVIAIKHTTDSTGENTGTSTTISATIDSDEGWSELEDAVSEELDKGLSDSVDVQIQLSGGEVNGDDLSRFAGKDLTLDLTTDSGVVWKIDMSNVSKDDISGKYDLGVTTTLIDPTEKKLDLDSESVYQVSFSGSTDFNASVGIRLADGAAYQKATLYQMIDGKLEAVQSVVVDADGVAWFNLAQTDKKTDYYIGVNPAELEAEDAVIPESLYQNYGMSDVSYLTDDNGISYEITGRTSSWGISGGQFALYAALAIGLMILIVSIVMITMNKMKQSRERWFGES
jgi:hypothetical protein